MAAATGDGGEGTAPSAPLHKLRGQPAAPEPVGVEHGWEGHPIPEGTEAEQQADGDDAVGPSEKRWPLLGDGDDGSDSRRGGKEPVRVRAAVPPVVGVKNSPGLMGTIGAVKSFLRVRKGRKKLTDTQPLPDGIDLSIPGIADAWAWFQTMDKDGSGHLDLKEVIALLYGLGLDFGRRRMKSVYHDMCSVSPIDGDLGVSFEAFAQWWSRHQAIARRDMRRAIRELFQEADHDKSGILSQEEFKLLVDAANRRKGLPALTMAAQTTSATFRERHGAVSGASQSGDSAVQIYQVGCSGQAKARHGDDVAGLAVPSHASTGGGGDEKSASSPSLDGILSLDKAWAEIRKVPFDSGNELGVNFAGFEAWWKERTGMSDPDIPVLPEFMVLRIQDRVAAERSWDTVLASRGGKEWQKRQQSQPKRSKHWTILAEKLRALVRMRNQWGDLHSIYEARTESLYHEEEELPTCIRDPDSTFSVVWDLASVLLLMYVTILVPLRLCFDVKLDLWSVGFLIDLAVDIFFVTDVGMNMRTSYYDDNGFRETRPGHIFTNYVYSFWFVIDVVSVLPVGYIQYIVAGDSDNASSVVNRGLKPLRLMKLTKMLRMVRLRKMLARWGSDANYHQFFSIAFTIFAIVFLAHMLACCFYVVGETNETLTNGQTVLGWVQSESNWWRITTGVNGTAQEEGVGEVDSDIALGTRYTSSLYYVLNALESGYTTSERAFAVFAELIRDVILGLVAGLITTISLSFASSDNATNVRLKRLRAWLEDKRIPKGFRTKIMQHFTELWTNQSNVNFDKILFEAPPAMASNLAEHLFARFLNTVPLFRGLSTEVINALALKCRPMKVMQGHTIIKEGEPGKEMYMILMGEVEVSEQRYRGLDAAPVPLGSGIRDQGPEKQQAGAFEDVRLGFLSEGAFFGEAPVLGRMESGIELRMRTVRAVTDSELCYLTRDDIHSLYDNYPELKARMARFGATGRVLTDTAMKKIDLSRQELSQFTKEFKQKQQVSSRIREDAGLHSDSFVPNKLMPAVRVIEAAGRFKRLSRLAKDRNKEDAALRELETRESLNNPDSNGENFGDHKYRQIQQDMVQMEKRIVDGIKVAQTHSGAADHTQLRPQPIESLQAQVQSMQEQMNTMATQMTKLVQHLTPP